jgi:murein DD-endopeptidase MepM/ murein hydrolase activator NlpD
MPQKRHTVIFVPQAHARMRKWQVSNVQLATAAAAFVLLTLAASWLAFSHFNTSVSPAEMSRLRDENSRLRQVNQGFESSLKTLQTKLATSEDRTRQLAIMAGLESLGSGAEVGVGGSAPVESTAASSPAALSRLHTRAAQVDGMLNEIEAKLEERVRWISSTPTIAPVRGIFTSGFGARSDPMTHEPGAHQGVDIAAATGQPVYAAADGLVMLAGTSNGYGEAIYLAHGYGLSTRYGHLSEIDVHPGQKVHRGDLIGRVGTTGHSTGAHLHYEVRLDGVAVNPTAYILDGATGPS